MDALDDHPDAALAAFPELSLTGYDLEVARESAVEAGDAVFDPIRAAALRNETGLVVGFAERWGTVMANSAACIDSDGRWVATYRKLQLFGAEADVFTAGDELLVVELAGRMVAPLICFDVEFPEHARAVSRDGAELLVTVAANMAPYGRDHVTATSARALDNRRPHLYVNQVGEQGSHRFVGESAAITSDGQPALVLGDKPAATICDLSFQSAQPDVDYLRLLRPTPVVNTVTTPILERISRR